MIDRARAEEILDCFEGLRLVVAGDLMLDRYVTGSVERISPEAPVPVVRVTEEHVQPGGAANVALNVQSLGAQAVLAGIVGRDAAGDELCELMSDTGVMTEHVLVDPGILTTVKTRIVGGSQQIVRVDHEHDAAKAEALGNEFCDSVRAASRGAAGIVIEDYGKGVITQPMVDMALTFGREQGILVGMDPKDNHELNVAGITLATPNFREACGFAGVVGAFSPSEPVEDDPQLREAGVVLRERWAAELLIITLGQYGMYLCSGDKDPTVIPTRARAVFDVSGAGDTVIAVAMLAMAAGASHSEAAALANYASGVVVGKVGTAPCSPAELLEAIA